MSDVLPESEFTPPRRGWPYVKIGLAVVGLLLVALLANHLPWLYQLRSARATLASSGYNLIFERRPELGITQIDDFLAEIYPNSLLVTEKSPVKAQVFPTACETPLFRNAGMVRVFRCESTRIPDEQVPHFATMWNLQSLEFDGRDLTDVGAARLEGLPQLRLLRIRCPQVTDAGISWIGDHKHLENLQLTEAQIGDQTATRIAQCQRLKYLNLTGTEITSVGCSELARLPNLQYIILSDTRITNAGCAELAKLPKLTLLEIASTDVDEALSEHVAKMRDLISINLSGTKAGDRVSKTLATLPNCIQVDLSGCPLTEAGVAAFKKPDARLQVRVISDHPELAEVTP